MSIRKRVGEAFDAKTLIDICERDDFTDYADYRPVVQSSDMTTPSLNRNGKPRFIYTKDNGSNILAVAHLDTVQADRRCTIVTSKTLGRLALSGALDDRLGAYIILELLPRMGITCDWLLTTDEEIGASTAQFFATDKKYNWMFSFDRGGTDVVMYDYRTQDLVKLVEASGARVGNGSLSDICYMKDLKISGFNWGTGYEDYHSMRGHAYLFDTFKMVTSFVRFFAENAETPLPYEKKVYPNNSYGASRGYNDYSSEWHGYSNRHTPDWSKTFRPEDEWTENNIKDGGRWEFSKNSTPTSSHFKWVHYDKSPPPSNPPLQLRTGSDWVEHNGVLVRKDSLETEQPVKTNHTAPLRRIKHKLAGKRLTDDTAPLNPTISDINQIIDGYIDADICPLCTNKMSNGFCVDCDFISYYDEVQLDPDTGKMIIKHGAQPYKNN